MKLANEIAECSPLGLLSTRATMRAGLADRVLAATNHELAEQIAPARDGRFQGRRQGHRRTPGGEFQGAVNIYLTTVIVRVARASRSTPQIREL